MCLAMEKKAQKDEIKGTIKILRSLGTSDNDIVQKILELLM